MSKIILASTSPRRKELLERESIDFIIDASSIDEILDPSLPLAERLKKLARDKGEPIHEKHPDDIVISADTTIYHHDTIIGKAKDKQEASEILHALSHDSHLVYTAVAIFHKEKCYAFVDETKVYFKNIDALIPAYLEQDEWMGKAGAYAIQGKAEVFIDHIDGDIDNVIGLPITHIKTILKDWGAIE